jgi:hypothetical protein
MEITKKAFTKAEKYGKINRGGIIIKKNKKVAKLLYFVLYNIVGSK